MPYLWNVWPGRGWPLDAEEERRLLAELEDAAEGADGTVRRDALIAALGAIRCGSTAGDITEAAPGLAAADIVASYRHIDQLRAGSIEAFRRMLAAGSLQEAEADIGPAGALLPAPTEMLRTVMTISGGGDTYRRAVMRVVSRMAEVDRAVGRITGMMPASDSPAEMGRLLFDPYNSALWDDPYFAARRPGQLTPVRVRSLLGEDQTSDLIFTDVHDIADGPGEAADGTQGSS